MARVNTEDFDGSLRYGRARAESVLCLASDRREGRRTHDFVSQDETHSGLVVDLFVSSTLRAPMTLASRLLLFRFCLLSGIRGALLAASST